MIDEAKLPVFLLGARASEPKVTTALHHFLRKHPIPVLETFQAAGCVSRELLHLFYGRLGLFRNQPGDKLLAHSDLVITVGYDPTEYDPPMWNPTGKLNVVHLDVKPCDWGFNYQPRLELVGSIEDTLLHLTEQAEQIPLDGATNDLCKSISKEFLRLERHQGRQTFRPFQSPRASVTLYFRSAVSRLRRHGRLLRHRHSLHLYEPIFLQLPAPPLPCLERAADPWCRTTLGDCSVFDSGSN